MTDITKNVLKKELAFFASKKEEYLKTYKGQFVLIKDSKFMGSYTSAEEAYKDGVEKFKGEPFLVRKVTEEDGTEDIPALTVGVINADI
ncbi:MAG: hypothetical protein A2172_01630 [Candidatus Woykebacteria bacterium RBG_13_40_15]|uniref:DUF5678 domain-containing protein n=1 Tax=Candidatus Woykebacteria bacterium RBG_13_40_15 TaxID=1802593 RepID=A0A1G1W570_9BACT|nr:MAG: hypothetical protein A2172_01630 [Candidatus Woykebacteria bacterium RBG_13_40_15]